ncbi:t-SNARE [Dichotomocladium elegans]|nr:t-SNARE [Dichotomocladium elegans]
MDGFLFEIEDLKRCIGIVSENVDRIERLHKSALGSYNDSQWKQCASEVDQLQGRIHAQNADIKARITALVTDARAANASEAEIRKAQSETVRKRFLDTLRRYQDIETAYRQEFRERVGRQIRIVKPDATDQEIDHIIESDQNNQIFAQSILHAGRKAQSRAVLDEVQNRYDDIKRIERTLLELHQLFLDMEMLITQQGEVLIQIDEHAETAAKQVSEGNKMIDRAIAYARATRGKKWCCLFLVIVLCVVIAILVWWFGFNHPGVDTN